METLACTRSPQVNQFSSIKVDPSLPTQETDGRTALQRFQTMLYDFTRIIQENRCTFDSVVEEGMKAYQKKGEEIKGLKDSQGDWGLTLTVAGATCMALAPLIPHLDSASLDLQTLFESLGGIETVRKLCETGSQIAEGVKPVATSWSEAQLLSEQTAKEFLETAFRQGQEAERNSKDLVQQLNHLFNKVCDTYSETRYG